MNLEGQVTLIIIQVIFYSGLTAPMVMELFWRWHRSELGWSIAAKTIALSLALSPAMLVYWFGVNALTTSDVLRWFSIVMLALVPLIIWWRVWVVYKQQRDGARHV